MVKNANDLKSFPAGSGQQLSSFQIIFAAFFFTALFAVVLLYLILFGADVPEQFFDQYRTITVPVLAVIWFGSVAIILKNLRTTTPYFLRQSYVIFSPYLILLLLLPYRFIPVQSQPTSALPNVLLIVACQLIFWKMTRYPGISTFSFLKIRNNHAIALLILFYTIIFGFLSVMQYRNCQMFNPQDVALYNQTLWNTVHGRFFENSTSGSNFVTHNSPFWILLTPFYAALPHPLTLLMLKTLFLALAAIPVYLIARHILGEKNILPLVIGFMFYPFLVTQNFAAPHEICFAPFFLLFSYYFFLKKKFWPFFAFLVICVSIKEHFSLVSIVYGIFALMERRSRRWIWIPLLLGIIWAAFSLWIIHHFQQIYNTDRFPAWYIVNLKERFLPGGSLSWQGVTAGLSTSNLGNTLNLSFSYQLVSPLLVFLPLLHVSCLLGIPEFAMNLLSDRLIFFPIWHYNIVVSCFLLVAATFSIRTIAQGHWMKYFMLGPAVARKMLIYLVLAGILTHHTIWIEWAKFNARSGFSQSIRHAASLIPEKASVSVTREFAPYVSGRRDYFLLGDGREGEYLLIDAGRGSFVKNLFETTKTRPYQNIFDQNGISLYRR